MNYQLVDGAITKAVAGGIDIIVGDKGTGSFTQSGGRNDSVNTLILANGVTGLGTYDLRGGTLTANSLTINGGGAFKQSGGENTVLGSLGSGRGIYNLSGGTLTVARTVQNNGLFTLSGGSFKGILNNNTDGKLELKGGTFEGMLNNNAGGTTMPAAQQHSAT